MYPQLKYSIIKAKITRHKTQQCRINGVFMNTANNSRYITTRDKIFKALLNLLKFKSFDEIYVKDICIEAGIHRSSFYAHFTDINDLLIKTEISLSKEITDILQTNSQFNLDKFEDLFVFIKEHKNFYKAYLKYSVPSFVEKNMYTQFKSSLMQVARKGKFYYPDKELEYHMQFFGGGLKSLCSLWLENNCKETPKQMAKIIHDQYANNARFFLEKLKTQNNETPIDNN